MTTKKKYTLIKSDTVTTWGGRTLYRIKAKRAIDRIGVAAGDLGGYVESEKNLSHDGSAWVSGEARVSGETQVYGSARVYGEAQVYGSAWVYGEARVYGANITATRSDNYTFTVAPTPEGPRIMAGCRYFTFEEAREHWTKTRGGTPLGDESLALVDHLERMATIRGFIEPVSAAMREEVK